MSGWSFLNKAETFLDRVLDESRDKEKQPDGLGAVTPVAALPATATATAAGDGQVEEVKASTARAGTPGTGGRMSLQERLARAAAASKSGSPGPAVKPADSKLDASKATAAVDKVILQEDVTNKAAETLQAAQKDEDLTENQKSPIFPTNRPDNASDAPGAAESRVEETPAAIEHAPRVSLQSARNSSDIGRASIDNARSCSDYARTSTDQAGLMQQDLEACEARRVQEVTQAAERISALESKLRFYTNEDLAASRNLLQLGEASELERKLAERDERIALLVQEGTTLAAKEGAHQETIRKLRARMAELEKLIGVSLKAVEKAEADVAKWKQEHKTIGEVSKRQADKIRQLSALETEADALRKLKTSHVSTISDLKRQLADEHATNVANASLASQLQSEKSKTDALQKRVGMLLQEAKEQADEHDAELAALQAKYDRLEERLQRIESDRKAEVFKLESEVEMLRAQVEESSASSVEHAQTKLLRQMENLQTQHSIAVQNWSRIEENLLARVSAAEEERDRLEDAEALLKTRLREQASKLKQIEENAAMSQGQFKRATDQQTELREEIATLKGKLQETTILLEKERETAKQERRQLEAHVDARVQERLESERSVYDASTAVYLQNQHSGARSPELSFGRADSPGGFSLRMPSTRPGLPIGRRSSSQAQGTPIPQRHTSHSHLHELEGLRSPPVPEDSVAPLITPSESASQSHAHEVPASRAMSIVTSTAGPGLGTMERITANVRKLEMELGMCREDLSRMTRQRDEARQTCVELDTVAAEKEALKLQLAQMAEAQAALTSKFEATLELLGEQTEENEQLREDIADMKQAYRDTLDKQYS
jgi:hypothetical protein